jgi:hypothetical protein
MARSLISNGQGYIFKAWPKPGQLVTQFSMNFSFTVQLFLFLARLTVRVTVTCSTHTVHVPAYYQVHGSVCSATTPHPLLLPLLPAGVNDDAKRRLLTAAAAHMQGAGEAVEKERLSECL